MGSTRWKGLRPASPTTSRSTSSGGGRFRGGAAEPRARANARLIWVRIFCRGGNLIDFAELIAKPLSGSIANG